MKKKISVQEAEALIAENLPRTGVEVRPLEDCIHRVLRQKLISPEPIPHFDRVIKDGYAIRSCDFAHALPNHLLCVGKSLAGMALRFDAEPTGHGVLCIHVATGSLMPSGFDAVIPWEWAEVSGADVRLRLPEGVHIHAGLNVHPCGSDSPAGACMASEGVRLNAVRCAQAASLGYAELTVSRPPRVGILSSGNELLPIRSPLKPGMQRISNPTAVASSLASCYWKAASCRHVPDDPGTLSAALKEMLEQVDAVVTLGGNSSGERDYTASVLESLSAQCVFNGVRQKPGKPFGFWLYETKPIFTLPGNPVSVLIGVQRYVLNALALMEGEAPAAASSGTASPVCLGQPFESEAGLTRFLPVRRTSSTTVQPLAGNNSGDWASLGPTDGFVELPEGRTCWEAGQECAFYPWR